MTENNIDNQETFNAQELTSAEARARVMKRAMEDSERTKNETLKALHYKLNKDIKNFTMKYMAENYIAHFLSDNLDESTYYIKLFEREIGNMRMPFRIVDERTGEVLFYINSLGTSFGTNFFEGSNMHVDNPEEILSHRLNRVYNNRQIASVPHLLSNAVLDVQESAEEILDIRMAEIMRYLGWYEIMDYLGIIPKDEEADYDTNVRQKREYYNHYVYWLPEMKLPEYVEKHGRPSYNGLNNMYLKAKGLPGSGSTPASPIVPSTDNFEDTDDWE